MTEKKEPQLTLETPIIVDIQGIKYAISELEPCWYKVLNIKTEMSYNVNPFDQVCNCPDFAYRTNGGTCKHIESLRELPELKPLIVSYDKQQQIRIKNIKQVNQNDDNQETVQQFQLMERKDEEQILQEIKGNVLSEFVYSFVTNGREITGLSYAGVKQIALKMGNIHCAEPILQENNGMWICKVKAVDVQRNLEMWGVSTQPKFMEFRDGRKARDDFCLQKCVSKAERNALRKLMPEKIIVEMLKEWKKQYNYRGNKK